MNLLSWPAQLAARQLSEVRSNCTRGPLDMASTTRQLFFSRNVILHFDSLPLSLLISAILKERLRWQKILLLFLRVLAPLIDGNAHRLSERSSASSTQ